MAPPGGRSSEIDGDEMSQPPQLAELQVEDEFAADEEAAVAMGLVGGPDGEEYSGQAGVNYDDLQDAGNSTREKRKRETQDGNEVLSVIERRTRAREAAKEAARACERQATKRAIEAATTELKEGPRDGTERLRALRQRIRDKEAAREAKVEGEGVNDGGVAGVSSPKGGASSCRQLKKKGAEPLDEQHDMIGDRSSKKMRCLSYASNVDRTNITTFGENEEAPRDPTASSSTMPWTGRLEMRTRPIARVPCDASTQGNQPVLSNPSSEPNVVDDPLVAEIKRRRRTSGHGSADPSCGEAVDKARRAGIG